jgi:hypothetical protein
MCKIIHENCDASMAEDKTLPSNSYLVNYYNEDNLRYDIVICNKRSDIFDMYWDKYREGLQSIKWTDGRVNPKLWGIAPKEAKKKK